MKEINKSIPTSDIIRKWEPMISNKFGFKNGDLIKIICIYCEWYISDHVIGTNTMEDEILRIYNESLSSIHIEIVGEYFNPLTGDVNYKLSNGDFINKRTLDYIPTIEVLNSLFGDEFLTSQWDRIVSISPQGLRNRQLERLI